MADNYHNQHGQLGNGDIREKLYEHYGYSEMSDEKKAQFDKALDQVLGENSSDWEGTDESERGQNQIDRSMSYEENADGWDREDYDLEDYDLDSGNEKWDLQQDQEEPEHTDEVERRNTRRL